MRTSVVCALLVLSVVGALGDDRQDHEDSERHGRHHEHEHHERSDLGAANGAEAEDVKEARIATQGMFDSDIRATRAFASLDDAMDGLKSELSTDSDDSSAPHKKTNEKLSGTSLLQEDAGRRNLGESDSQEEASLDASTEGMYDADVRATRAFTALDDQMDTLKADMTQAPSTKSELITPSTDDDAPKSKDMGESDDEKRDDKRDDDDDEDRDDGRDDALIQVGSTKGFGEALANKLVMDDLKTSGSSLMARAKMEASQWSSMNKIEAGEEQETRQDLAEAKDSVDAFTSDDNALEVTELDEADAASKAQQVKQAGGLAVQLQRAETKQAREYMAQAANKESAIIARAEAKEKKMETDARNVLVKDVKRIKKDEQDATWHMKKTPA